MFGTSFSVRLLLKGMVTPPEEFFPRSLRQELSAINVYLSVFEERADALHANFAAKSFDEHSLYALHYLLKPLKLFQHCICIIVGNLVFDALEFDVAVQPYLARNKKSGGQETTTGLIKDMSNAAEHPERSRRWLIRRIEEIFKYMMTSRS
ncbi:hypothetical protein KCV03_g402, partial [Aureobasidium melanogenum]